MSLISAGSISLDSTFKCSKKYQRWCRKSKRFEWYPLLTPLFFGWTIPLNEYVAEIQLPDNGISHLAAVRIPKMFYTEFWNSLALVIKHHIM
jgi:hypothetical protein